MADSQSILQLGIEAARAGDKAEARELFRLVTREDPNNPQGWLWLAGVAEDREEKRAALERVVQIDPSNELARKGLAALGGAAAARTAPAPAPEAPVEPVTPTPAAPQDRDAAEVVDANEDYVAAPRHRRAQVYTQPEQVGRDVPPDFDDDYDLSEYQTRSDTRVDDRAEHDADTVVLVEDEEPRRRGLAAFWPLLLIGLLALGVLFFLLSRNFLGNGVVAVDPNASAGAVGAASAAATAEGSAAGTAPAATSDATGLLTSPAADASAAASVAVGTEGSAGAGPVADASAAPVPAGAAGQASAPADAAASAPAASPAPAAGVGQASAPADAAASAPAASPAPAAGVGQASAPADAAASAPAASPAPAPAPSVAAAPAAPAPADVATANPAIVGNDQVLRAGNFEYTFTGLSNVATGSYGGAPPARGRYVIVLLAVRNIGNTAAQIPDGFFVIKDAQGRVSDFNRAASVDYINRFGGAGPRGAGDFPADATLPPGGQLGSVPLLFDVAADATDLVAFSRENTSQGFLVRQSAR